MNRSDVAELHFITSIANVPSIMAHGILSHNLSRKLPHDSVAEPSVQERRKNKQIPGARPLHDYANLYFDAHNPMLSKRRDQNDRICVLRVDPAVLDLPDVIIADCNAATTMVRFFTVEDGLKAIKRERVFAQYWKHPGDPLGEAIHKAEKCAEVLIPDRVEKRFIAGAYVVNEKALALFERQNTGLSVAVKRDMFF